MFLAEYENVKDYSYDRYCRYLIDKYGRPEHDFFNPKCKRSSEGLEVHHVKEDEIPGLCDRKVAALYDESFQAPENLVCCDYLEHLFLHILIGEKTAGGKNIGLNGAFLHIIPAIKSYYDGEKGRYNDAYYKRLDGCEGVFDLLIGRYNKLIEETNVVFETNAVLYQQMENALNTKGRALVVLGTGLGKTTTALNYLWTHKCRALIVCPNKLIKSSWEERYPEWCDAVSFIGLARSYKSIDYSKYGVVIVDEAHHAGYDEQADAGAKVWSKGIEYILGLGVKVIGLTATPERSDAINVGKTIFKGCVCEGLAVEDAIDKGDVYPFSYISALYDAPAIAEEYKDCQSRELVGQLDVAINNTPTLKEIFAENMPAGERKGIIFIQDIADEAKVLEIVKDVFPDAEYRAIHSKMPVDEVKTNREWFENTRSGYLLAVNMISEGAHYPGVNTLIMFRRTSSYLVFTQQLGRIITLKNDPDPHAIVFDLVNNVENVVYNSEMVDKNTHSVHKIYEAIKRQAEKSNQIIVKDETRNIVDCIRRIKDSEKTDWLDWEDAILIEHYSTEGTKKSQKRINDRRKSEYLIERTVNAVKSRVAFLGLERTGIKKKEYWSEEEIKVFKTYWLTEREEVLSRLPGHTIEGCRIMATKLKLYSKKWSPDEIKTLQCYYAVDRKKCLEELRKINPRRSRVTMRAKANTLGLTITPSWTNEEIETLKKFFPIEGGMCYKRFENKTKSSVVGYANKLGIHSQKYWTSEEISILKQYYPTEGIGVVKRLPNRNKDTCQAKAQSLGIKSNNKSCPRNTQWTNEEDDIIRRFYPTEGFDCLHRLPGRSKSSVQSRACILGVKSIKEQDMSFCSKSVRCVETGIVYKSITEAKKECGGDVYQCLKKGPQATAGGYHWEYVEDDQSK